MSAVPPIFAGGKLVSDFKIKSELFGPGSARSYKISVAGNNWLVGNAISSETALRIFLIFCIKLGGYKGRKSDRAGFLKKILDLEIFAKTNSN